MDLVVFVGSWVVGVWFVFVVWCVWVIEVVVVGVL